MHVYRPTTSEHTRLISRVASGFYFIFILILFVVFPGLMGCDSENAIQENNDSPISDGDTATASDGDMDGDPEPPNDIQETIACTANAECPSTTACDPYNFVCRTEECAMQADCVGQYGIASTCSDSGLCLPIPCAGNEICPDGHYCTTGFCMPYPACAALSDLIVESGTLITRTGQHMQVVARAIDAAGTALPELAAIQASVEWRSLNSDVVSIITENGGNVILLGGPISGTTTVLARLAFENDACSGIELSVSLSVQNFAQIDEGLRVILVEQHSGSLVGGATVEVNGVSRLTAEDINAGVALFENVEPPYRVHVFHPDYHYLSLINLTESDLLLPLLPFDGPHQKAGIKGTPDLSQTPEILQRSGFVSLLGLAYTASLLDLLPGGLFSPTLLQPAAVRGPFHDQLSLPANIRLHPIAGDENTLIYATGSSSSPAAWGLGGFLNATDYMSLVVDSIYDGWTNMGAFVVTALTNSAQYFHGILSGIQVESLPMLTDNGNGDTQPSNQIDINGDNTTDDFVPDYAGFLSIGDELKLSHPMNQRVKARLGRLPLMNLKPVGGVFTILGSRLLSSEQAFIPVGLAMKQISQNGHLDKPSVGMGGDLWTPFTPYYGGLTNEYTAIAYALEFADLFPTENCALSYSAIVADYDGQSEELEFGDFLALPTYAAMTTDERRLEFIPVEGAPIHRLRVIANGRQWEIYIETPDTERDTVVINLPQPPLEDVLDGHLSVTALDMQPNQSLDHFAGFNQVSLATIDRYFTRFSTYAIRSAQ